MHWSLQVSLLVLIGGGAAIAVLGYRFTALVDRLADRTGLGEAFAGGVLLGATTSLPDTVLTVTAAADGAVDLAVGNALGGIAAQTMFLAVADVTYRRVNLEHAAASVPNLLYGLLLLVLLLIPMLAHAAPDIAVLGIHPVSPLLLLLYWQGMKRVHGSHRHPMWLPRRTRYTHEDTPAASPPGERLVSLWGRFFIMAPLLGLTGWALAKAAESLVEHTGLSGAFVGGLFTALVTSMSELVVALSAIKQRALTLAIANVIGGNAFDALQLPLADLAYRGETSIYEALSDGSQFLASLTALMTAVLLVGLLEREERGLANIGIEGVSILALYVGGMWALYSF